MNKEKQCLELKPEQLLKHAKKHPHTHNVSSEAFSVAGIDAVIYNVSMKGDPENQFDVLNYRRGLTFLEEIIDFKEGPLRVARKGLRKFTDLLPEYFDIKSSHASTSRHHLTCKARIFTPLKESKADEFIIYSTQKANGQNLQISWDSAGFWVIGSKTKTLLLAEEKDMKYISRKYEHVRTLSIAEQWFAILNKNPEKVQSIKEKLSAFTLVGEICDSVKCGHIVDYGSQIKLFFYALVEKEQSVNSCESPSELLNFLKENNLEEHCVNYKVTRVKTYEALTDELHAELIKVSESSIEQAGEGIVVYVSIANGDTEQCLSVCKIKTLEYRIYRKLRQKLKVHFEKLTNQNKLLNKLIEELKELTKGFKTPKPLEYYIEFSKRAFELCEFQDKAVVKFVHNKYIDFLKIVGNDKIDQQAFLAIARDPSNADFQKLIEEKSTKSKPAKNKQANEEQVVASKAGKVGTRKNVAIFLTLAIPSTGKSSLFRRIKEKCGSDYCIQILSSDTVRQEVMKQKMKKTKSLTKKQAYDRTRKQGNARFYKYMEQILKSMGKNEEHQNMILFLDKNFPENALRPVLQEINSKTSKIPEINAKVIAILPKCDLLLEEKPKYMYPFSSCYIATCMKRIISRQVHETLEGTVNYRTSVCINFANLYRNFSLSDYNLSKYFDGMVKFPFTRQTQIDPQIENGIITILKSSKPGTFQEHEALEDLLSKLHAWDMKELDLEESKDESLKEIKKIFEDFENFRITPCEKKEQEEVSQKLKKKRGKKQQENSDEQVEAESKSSSNEQNDP